MKEKYLHALLLCNSTSFCTTEEMYLEKYEWNCYILYITTWNGSDVLVKLYSQKPILHLHNSMSMESIAQVGRREILDSQGQNTVQWLGC